MSIERCIECGSHIDTDYDDGAYGELGDEEPRCSRCRDNDYDQAAEDWYNDPRRGQAAAINRENYKEPRQ